MKRLVFFLFLGGIPTALAQVPAVKPPAIKPPAPSPAGAVVAQPDQDVIYTKAGTQIAGTITRRVKDNIEVRSKSPAGALVSQTVPIANVDHVDFAGSDKREAELAGYQAANLAIVLQKWRAQRDLLDLPESPAGAYGIRSAQLLLESPSAETAKTAGDILNQIVEKDWDPVRHDRARALTIESLRRSGKHDEAEKAAREFLDKDAAAESKAEVSYYLALALVDDYRAFIKENPRWESDAYVRPKRDHVYNEVLDCMLAPYLRYGAPPEITAKSLLAATKFLDEFGEHLEARNLAQDLVTIFPTQPEAEPAKKFLAN
ncbi:MAG: hypothetical protein PHC88_10290 [Terrimicrobiaceae bacterium]|nr:hypothetical protein [Terrimicrobiaceae bacterium]